MNKLVLIDQAIFSGSNFVTTLLLARILSPADFGMYALLWLYVYALMNITNALMMQPLQVILPTKNKEYVHFSFFVYIILVGLLVGISSFFVAKNVFWVSILVAGFLWQDYFRKLFLAQNKVSEVIVLDAIQAILQVGALGCCYVGKGASSATVIQIIALSYLPVFVIGTWLLKPSLEHWKEWQTYLPVHFQQSYWLLLTAFLQWFSSNFLVVASGFVLGAEALGALRLVQSLFGVLNIILQTFENYALPQATKLWTISAQSSKTYLQKISWQSLQTAGLLLLILFVFAEPIMVACGGEKYEKYAFLVRGMAILYALIFGSYPIRIAVRMMLLNKVFFVGYALAFVFNLVSFYYLLHTWHLSGVLLGFIANQMIMIFVWQYFLIKQNFLLWK
jgi:O-antigen/teichoic acid export membrane protein